MQATIQGNFKSRYIIKAVLSGVVFTGLFIAFSFAKNFIPNKFERLTHGIIGTLAAFLTIVIFLRIDRKQFSDIGLTFRRNTAIKFFVGVIVGIVIMGLLAMSTMYLSNVRIEVNKGSNGWHFLLVTLPLIPLAFMEELGFRAYPLEILKDRVGIRLSIIITSLLFALYHIVNGWPIASAFYGPAVWGLIFGMAAVYSKGISMPTGIHYAANLTTSAFGETNNTVSIWVIEQSRMSTTKYLRADWIRILPALVLFVFAILCLAICMRRKTITDSALEKAGTMN